FPEDDLSPEKKRKKLRKLLDYDYSRLIRRGVVKQVTHFNRIASSYFPRMSDVRAGGKRTPRELYADSIEFPKAMAKRGKLRERSKQEHEEEKNVPNIFHDYLPPSVLTRSSIQKALRTYSGTQGVSNFSPVAAAAIYHHLLPAQGGVTWDMSCGWGGRLLGAIACDKVHKYIGCDPSTETYNGLMKMRAELLPMVRVMGRNLEIELHMLGSEMMRSKLKPNSVDLCFTSPPYFAQEEYSQEETQSYKKFPTKEAWLTGFMGTTLDNCKYCLKPEGLLAVNIADVSSHPTLAQEFVGYAQGHGWRLVKTMKLNLSSMVGGTKYKKCRKCQRLTGEANHTEPVLPTFSGKWRKCPEHKFKREPIFVFRKNSRHLADPKEIYASDVR
ncbi:MAG: DNA methyltransferase, partial [Candidatus Acidiferrales bacterium]